MLDTTCVIVSLMHKNLQSTHLRERPLAESMYHVLHAEHTSCHSVGTPYVASAQIGLFFWAWPGQVTDERPRLPG